MVCGRQVYRAINVRRRYVEAVYALSKSDYKVALERINEIMAVQPSWVGAEHMLKEQGIYAKKFVHANRKRTLE